MKKIKVILSVLLMAAAISFTACSNASSGSDSGKTEKEDKKTPEPKKPGSGNGGSSGGGNQTPAVTYIGSKAPSQAKAVGDVVFNDGSATPYNNRIRFTDAQKNAAIAIIFYVGTDLNSDAADGTSDTSKSRTLGLGLKHTSQGLEWCKSTAKAHDNTVSSINCTCAGENGSYTIRGDKNGSDNLEQIATNLSSDNDTNTPDNYPAFYFAKAYNTKAANLELFNTNWFLPGIAELNQLYINGKGDKKNFDIDAALEALSGDKLAELKFWSASEFGEATKAYVFDFGTGNLESKEKADLSSHACAIRDFTSYSVTLQSTAQVTITADKEKATAGEKVTLSYTTATSDDYDVIFKNYIVMNGSNSVAVNNNSFVMPAGDVTVSAEVDVIPCYSITILPSTGGSVTANKMNKIKAGEIITLTVTPYPDDNNNFKLKSLKMDDIELSVSNMQASFSMPDSHVTITAVFEGIPFVGTKNPSKEKEVYDIVFNDGSSMSYVDFNSITDDTVKNDKRASAIAVIYYKGTGLNSDAADGTPDNTTIRTLGVGLKHVKNKNPNYIHWCTELANGKRCIDTIKCSYTQNGDIYSFTGDKNGSDNLEQIATALGLDDDDTETQDNYPAFYYAKNYSNRANNLASYNNNWYLPSIAELYEITKVISQINLISQALGGDTFQETPYSSGRIEYWSSSQSGNYDENACDLWISTTYSPSSWTKSSGYGINACCIREFN